jgi:predicted O-methyltransferase YrrM
MIKKIVYSVLTSLHRAQAMKKLRALEQKLQSREARFALPFVYRGSGYFKTIEPRQNASEIESLYKYICELSPKNILEIGTARGGTLYLWTQAAKDDAIIVSVDLPGGNFGGAYPTCRIPFYQAFAKPSQNLHLLRCDSHSHKTLETVQKLFDAKPLDFIFIDGDHTYEGVKTDFRFYSPLVRPGGLIGIHDILPRPDLPEIQVDRFWKEIRKKHDTIELVGPISSGRQIGIGLIRVSNSGIDR